MPVVRVPWDSSSFLLYTGGLTVLAATLALLSSLSGDHATAGFAGLSLVVLVVAAVLALAAAAAGREVVAGLLALTAVVALVVFVGALLDWIGWFTDKDAPFAGFHAGDLLVELVAFAASFFALLVFRFPLLVLFGTAAAWFFVTDLISNGGNWSAWVTLLFGLALVLVGLIVSPVYGFWVHVVAGATIGGALLAFWHEGDFRWILLGLSALVFVAIAALLERSSYAVLGTLGLFLAFQHFLQSSDEDSASLPFGLPFGVGEPDRPGWETALWYAAFGLGLMLIGVVLARRRAVPQPSA